MKTIQFGKRGIAITLRKAGNGLDVGVVVPEEKMRWALAEIDRFRKGAQIIPGFHAVVDVVMRIEAAVLDVLAEPRQPTDPPTKH
jgi:hypothetical protein